MTHRFRPCYRTRSGRRSARLGLLLLVVPVSCGEPTEPDDSVAGVKVWPDTATLSVGGTRQMQAEATTAAGLVLSGQQVGWSSADPAVATVSAAGLVEARAPGRTAIRAEAAGRRDSAIVTVVAPLPSALSLQEIVGGVAATHAASPRGDPRLFLATLDGRVLVLRGGSPTPAPFLDLRSRVKGGAHGLYSIAFHPRFTSNGFIYVAYVDSASALRIERYTAFGESADAGSARLVLRIDHPPPYDHFGGWIGFGPDGMLYVTSGDGGPGNSANAQNRGTLLGKLLRIDVDGGDPYAVPPGNPFVGVPGARPEIWATGLRNPWRASIDRETGLLYLADVGEDDWEEVNVAPIATAGLNYGWDRMEGPGCFPRGTAGCDRGGLTLPALAYPLPGSPGATGASHPPGCSVTGGMVYRGTRIPSLQGHYFYADFCAGWVRSFRYEGGAVKEPREWFSGVGPIISFGEDSAGELYVLTLNGRIHRIVPRGS